MQPLISVTMPSFNAAGTLPMALASLIAQTYENWECVLVDDGSTDDTREVVEAVRDPRIRCFRLEKNMGRGVASQKALDEARGQYLCMLDADDWYYPRKLARQIEVMEAEPKAALASCGMCIVDENGDIAGVRCTGRSDELLGPFEKLSMPPVAHAPSIIRMPIAKSARYDPVFRTSQDVDFLLSILLGRQYIILPDAMYVYSEHSSVNLGKILEAHSYVRQMFRKYRKRFPMACGVNIAKSYIKSACYWLAFRAGLGKWVIGKRSRRASAEEIKAFNTARMEVMAIRDKIFPSHITGKSRCG